MYCRGHLCCVNEIFVFSRDTYMIVVYSSFPIDVNLILGDAFAMLFCITQIFTLLVPLTYFSWLFIRH
jgi:hypothetical protein